MPRTVGLYFAEAAAATAAVDAFRAHGIEEEIASAPVVVDGAEGTILAIDVDDDSPAAPLDLALEHGGIVVASIPNEWIRSPPD